MTAQVAFITTLYFPDNEERVRLQKLQDRLNSGRIELLFATRYLDAAERYLSFQRYHNGFRNRWVIYPGFRNE